MSVNRPYVAIPISIADTFAPATTTIEDKVLAAASTALPSSTAQEDLLFLDGFQINIEDLMKQSPRQIPSTMATARAAASLKAHPTPPRDEFVDPFEKVLLTQTPTANAPAALTKESVSKKRKINQLSDEEVSPSEKTTPSPFVTHARKWSKRELEILTACPTFQAALRIPLLKAHPRKSIRKQWLKAHPEDKKSLPWTPQEDAIIRRHTSLEEAKSDFRLKHRTATAIQHRWNLLNSLAKIKDMAASASLQSNSLPTLSEKWSEEELQAIKCSSFKEALKTPMLQKHSQDSIRKEWIKGHPERKKSLPWTLGEDAILYSHTRLKEATKEPRLKHRTNKAIAIRWARLKRLAKKA